MNVTVKPGTNIRIPGSWNPAIIEPVWVTRELPWLKNPGQVEVQVAVGISPAAVRFRLEDVLIQPTPGRLELYAQKEEVSVYERMSKIAVEIAARLPHTPITAIGHNIAYVLSEEEEFVKLPGNDLDDLQEWYRSVAEAIAVNSCKMTHTIQYDDHIINIAYVVGRQERGIEFNYHYAVGGAVSQTRDFLTRLPIDVRHSEELSKELVQSR